MGVNKDMKTHRCNFLVALVFFVVCGCPKVPSVDKTKDNKDYKTLAPAINALLQEWRNTKGTELIVNLKSRTLRLGKKGESVVTLPHGYAWSAYHITPGGHVRLPEIVTLKLHTQEGEKNACQEIIHIQGTLTEEAGIYFDIRPGGYADSGTGIALLNSYAFKRKKGKRYTVNESILVRDENANKAIDSDKQ